MKSLFVKRCKHVLIVLLTVLLISEFVFVPTSFADDEMIDEIREISEGIIEWKKSELKIKTSDDLFNNAYLENAGSSSGDWYPLGIGRLGYQDDYKAYLAVINDVLTKRYEKKHKLNKTKATEWHRISLAILAMGGDPTSVGVDQSINLIQDGTYDRSKVKDIGAQGINGLTWGLLTLDALRYEIPKNAADSRDDLIKRILSEQLTDGGFSLQLPPSDVDLTAMTLQALAPYYNSEQLYKYVRKADGKQREVTVREVVDEALELLSKSQTDSGAFESMGIANTESTVQVIVALTALQISPFDEAFVKNDQTVFDGLKTFRLDDGGFVHSHTFDEDNPTARPDESNSMASEQSLYGLSALLRYFTESRTLYDFREEMSAAQKADIRNSINEIDMAIKGKDKSSLETAFNNYLNIPIEERSYVSNYALLADELKKQNIVNESEHLSKHMGINKSGNGYVIQLLDENNETLETTHFSEKDAQQVAELTKKLSTEYDVAVVKLIDVLNKAENKAAYANELMMLEEQKVKIDNLKKEIDDINKLIMKELYPFESIGKKDEATVKHITKTYHQLSEFDQRKIQSYEDVEKAETQIKNLKRASIIKLISALIMIVLISVLIYRRKVRKREKLKKKMLL